MANAGADDQVCETDTYTLSGIASDQQNVLWSTAGDGTFDDVTLLGAIYTPGTADISAGTVDLSLTATAIAPCASDSSDTMTLTIQYAPTADAGMDDIVCETDSYTLSGIATHQQSVMWTTAGDGTFSDASLPGAIYTPGAADIAAGTVNLTFTAYAISPCTNDDSDIMTLSIQNAPTADAGVDDIVCENDTYTLNGIATNEQSTLWTTAGDGTFDDPASLGAIYTPGATDIGVGNVILTLTSYAISPCLVEDSDNIQLTIQYLPTADAGIDDFVCETDPYTLSGVASYQQSTMWITSGDGTFDDPTLLSAMYTPGAGDLAAGTVDLTLTAYAITPCTINESDIMTLSFQSAPTADAGIDDLICETDTYTLSGVATNEQSTLWTTIGDGFFDDPTLLSPVYTPGSNDIINGSVVLTFTAYAISPCTVESNDDMTLSIQASPVADAGNDATTCETDNYTLSGVASDYQSVLWTSSGDGTFDDPTLLAATYTPGSNDMTVGSATLTLTAYAISPCVVEVSDDMILFMQSPPEANAGSDDEVCSDASYQMNGSAQNENNIFWLTLGDGTFDDASAIDAMYTPGAGDIEAGNVDLVLFAYSIPPCVGEDSDTMNLVINPAATAFAGYDDNICETESFPLEGEVNNNNGLLWSTAGDGTFDDPTILEAIYTPGTTDIGVGYVELTITAYGNADCPEDAIDNMTLIIYKSPGQPILPIGPTAINLDEITESEYYINIVDNTDTYTWVLEPIEAGTINGADTMATATWNMDYTGLVAQIFVMVENSHCDPVTSEILEIGISPVNIPNLLLESGIIIYPNPTIGKFDIEFSGYNGNIEIQIISEMGEVIDIIKNINVDKLHKERVDISSYPASTYYLRIVSKDGTIIKKIVKK